MIQQRTQTPARFRMACIFTLLASVVAPAMARADVVESPGTTLVNAIDGMPYDDSEVACPRGESRWVDRHGCPVLPTDGDPESVTCGGFEVDFADVIESTGTGFDDPAWGTIRRDTVCQVLIDLANVIDLGLPLGMGSHPDLYVDRAEDDGQGPLASGSPLFPVGAQGCTAGALHEHITTGIDPTPGPGDYDAVIRQVDFGDRGFGGSTVSVNPDWNVVPTTDLDLYSIILHEVTHALGFFSMIGPSGESVQSGRFALFDAFLADGDAQKLIDPSCTAFQGSTDELTSNQVRYNTPASHNSTPQPVYSPRVYKAGSSLSHFDTLRGGMRYVMRPSTIGGADRAYTEPELDVLCDLGYMLFGTTCDNHYPVGVDDDDLLANSTTPGVEVCIDVLANDFDPDGDPISIDPASVQIVSGSGVFIVSGNAICYRPPTGFTGIALMTYQPSDGQRLGNITRVLVDVPSNICPSDPCNLVCNGGFETGVPDDDVLDFGSLTGCPSKVDGWCHSVGTPELFMRTSVTAHFGIPMNFFSGEAPGGQIDTWNGVGNDRYVGIISDGFINFTEGIFSQMPSPLVAGRAYSLRFLAYAIRPGPWPVVDAHVEVFLDTVAPDNGPPSPNAQFLGGYTVPQDTQWNTISIPFTANSSQLQYIIIQTEFPPPADTRTYVYLDDIALSETATNSFDIVKWVDDPTPAIGQVIEYTIAVCNLNTDTAFNVIIEDLLPGGLSYAGGFNNYPHHTFASIGGESCRVVTVAATVDLDVPLNQPLTNCASLASNGSMCGSFEDSSHCVDIIVSGTDISVDKRANPMNPLPGSTVVFTIEIANLGAVDASEIAADDLLPLGLTFQSVSAPNATYDPTSGNIRLPFLAAGETEVLEIVATVDPEACDTTIVNTVTLVGVDTLDTDSTNNQASATITVRSCHGDCTGSFVDSGQLLGNETSLAVALGDLDGDGDLDAAVGNFGQPTTLWRNNGAGQFTLLQSLATDKDVAIALGDLDRDGDLDLFVADNSGPGTVWINVGSGFMIDSGQRLGSANSLDAALGDINDDGLLHIVVANSGPNQIWLNDGAGTFTAGQAFGDGASWGIALADTDRNGRIDAYVTNAGPDHLWRNISGTLYDSAQALSPLTGRKVAFGEIHGHDDYPDLVIRTVTGQVNEVWRNNGGFFFNTNQTLGTRGNAVALGDLDCNGSVDTYFGNGGVNRTWLNDGNGVFSVGQGMGGSTSTAIALGDVDGDGDLDAFVANNGQPNRVWFNN